MSCSNRKMLLWNSFLFVQGNDGKVCDTRWTGGDERKDVKYAYNPILFDDPDNIGFRDSIWLNRPERAGGIIFPDVPPDSYATPSAVAQESSPF